MTPLIRDLRVMGAVEIRRCVTTFTRIEIGARKAVRGRSTRLSRWQPRSDTSRHSYPPLWKVCDSQCLCAVIVQNGLTRSPT